jgi:hypothetical protein
LKRVSGSIFGEAPSAGLSGDKRATFGCIEPDPFINHLFGHRRFNLGVAISVYCLRGGKGPTQQELVRALTEFLGAAGTIVEQTSAESSGVGFTVQLELGPEEDRDQWAVRLRGFLRRQRVQSGATICVIPPDWEKPGDPVRTIRVYG